MRATLSAPEVRRIDQPVQVERIERCRMSDRRRNPCPNPALTDYGMCLKHLSGAHAEFEAILAEANRKQTGSTLLNPRETVARTS